MGDDIAAEAAVRLEGRAQTASAFLSGGAVLLGLGALAAFPQAVFFVFFRHAWPMVYVFVYGIAKMALGPAGLAVLLALPAAFTWLVAVQAALRASGVGTELAQLALPSLIARATIAPRATLRELAGTSLVGAAPFPTSDLRIDRFFVLLAVAVVSAVAAAVMRFFDQDMSDDVLAGYAVAFLVALVSGAAALNTGATLVKTISARMLGRPW